MTAVIVLISIIAVLCLLLYVSLTVYVAITDNVSIKIGALGFKFAIAPSKGKPEKPKRKKKKKQTNEKKEDAPKKEVTKDSFGETVTLVLSSIKAVLNPTQKLLSKVRLTSVDINIAVCGDEADETAIKFGGVTTAIYNVLGLLSTLIKVKIKRVSIRPDFVGDEDRFDISFKVKLRLYQIIGAGVRIFYKLVVNTITKKQAQPQNKNNVKEEKKA